MNWISVSDRLPQDKQRVLIWRKEDWQEAEFAGGRFYVADWNGELTQDFGTVEYWAEVKMPGEE